MTVGEDKGKPKRDKFDEYGQLAIGYDMAKARAWVLDHAQKNLPAKYDWLQGLQLTWEITTAEFKEGQDAYEVIVSCYPEGAEVQAKGEWLYHVDVRGQLMPGTPVLRKVGIFGRLPTGVKAPQGEYSAFGVTGEASPSSASARPTVKRTGPDSWLLKSGGVFHTVRVRQRMFADFAIEVDGVVVRECSGAKAAGEFVNFTVLGSPCALETKQGLWGLKYALYVDGELAR